MTPGRVREDGYATVTVRCEEGKEFDALEGLREKLKGESELVILFGDPIKGPLIRQFVDFRRQPGHSGEVRLPGGLFQLARRF